MSKSHSLPNDIILKEVCQLLAHGKSVKLRAKGNSMKPFIYGDIDILLLTPSSGLRKGDIVLAKTGNTTYVVHRVIRINGQSILLAGDSNLFQQEKCDRANIFGTVKFILRNGQRHSLTTLSSRLLAIGWHRLLPLRRLHWKIRNFLSEK